MKSLYKIILSILVFLLSIAGIVFWFSWQGDSAKIIKAATSFQAPSSWEMTEDIVYPPQNFCLTQICPSVTRTWKVDSVIAKKDDLQNFFEKSSFKIDFADDCFEELQTGSRSQSCSGIAIKNGYKYNISYFNSSSDEPSITIFVTENN